jgi:glycosyltransferase involved in cell wall biosynthesis
MIKETGAEGHVRLYGPVCHEKSLALQKGADAVLLTSAKVEDGSDYSIAGKLYEYFGLRKKILAVVTKGAMRDFVHRSGLGLVADPDDTDAIARAIKSVASKEFNPLPDAREEAFIRSLDSKNSADQMLAELEFAVKEGYRRGRGGA